MNTITEIEEETLVDTLVEELVEPNKAIVVYNDDVNDFLHVINCFMMYCDHAKEQAEQCALIVHNKGKCDIKHGSFEKLKPVCEALLEHGLTAKIE